MRTENTQIFTYKRWWYIHENKRTKIRHCPFSRQVMGIPSRAILLVQQSTTLRQASWFYGLILSFRVPRVLYPSAFPQKIFQAKEAEFKALGAKTVIIKLPMPKSSHTSKTVLFNLSSTSRLNNPLNRNGNFPTWKQLFTETTLSGLTQLGPLLSHRHKLEHRMWLQ